MITRGSFCFWCDYVTPHWLYTLSELGGFLDVEVNVIASTLAQLDDRRAMGWRATEDLPNLVIRQHSQALEMEAIARAGGHLVANPFNNPAHRRLVRCLRDRNIQYGFQHSMPGLVARPLGRFIRRLFYRCFFGRELLRAEYILCHGEMTRSYFRNLGIPVEKLYASGYFVPSDGGPVGGVAVEYPIRVVYLGQFIKRKAVDRLACAIAESDYAQGKISIDFAGVGPLKEKLMQVVAARHGRVLPPVPYERIISFLRGYDILVLPSVADEWGVVINEAIHAGCGVVTTEKCGASDLVLGAGCGAVVRDAEECARVLVAAVDQRGLVSRWKEAANQLSSQITSKEGARYLAEIITRKRSAMAPPPWGNHQREA